MVVFNYHKFAIDAQLIAMELYEFVASVNTLTSRVRISNLFLINEASIISMQYITCQFKQKNMLKFSLILCLSDETMVWLR